MKKLALALTAWLWAAAAALAAQPQHGNVVDYDTVDNLLLANPQGLTSTYIVKGLHAVGDNLGGTFYYDPASVVPADGSTSFVWGTGRLLRLVEPGNNLSPPFYKVSNVEGTVGALAVTNSLTVTGTGSNWVNQLTIDKLFTDIRNTGAGDGISDNTAFIQAALNSSTNVFIPAGTYLITGTLQGHDNQTIQGTGPASVIQTTSQADILQFNNCTNFHVTGVRFVQSGILTGSDRESCIAIHNASLGTIQLCTFENYGFAGISATNAADVRIIGNNFPNSVVTSPGGVQRQDADVELYGGIHRFELAHNSFNSGSTFGLQLFDGYWGDYSDSVNVHDNTFINHSGYGAVYYINPPVGLGIQNCKFINNYVANISGSYVNPNFPTNHYYGSGFYNQGAVNTLVSGNTITNCNLYNRHALLGDLSPGCIAVNTGSGIIVNNHLEDGWQTGIQIGNVNKTDTWLVTGNVVTNCGRWLVTATGNNGQAVVTVSKNGGFLAGDPVILEGAGTAGANLYTTIASTNAIAGTVTLGNNLITSVVSANLYADNSANPIPHGGIIIPRTGNVQITGNPLVTGCWPVGIGIWSDNTVPSQGNNVVNGNLVANCPTNVWIIHQTNWTANGNTIANASKVGLLLDPVLAFGQATGNTLQGNPFGMWIDGAFYTNNFVGGNRFLQNTTAAYGPDPAMFTANQYSDNVTNVDGLTHGGFYGYSHWWESDNQPIDSDNYGVVIGATNNAPLLNTGGSLGFAGWDYTNGAGIPLTKTVFGSVSGRKLNASNGDIGGYLVLAARANGTTHETRVLRLEPTQAVLFPNNDDNAANEGTWDASGNVTAPGIGSWAKLGVGTTTPATYGGYVGVKVPTGQTQFGIIAGTSGTWQFGANAGANTSDSTFSVYSADWSLMSGNSNPLLKVQTNGMVTLAAHLTVVSNANVNGTFRGEFVSPGNMSASSLALTDGLTNLVSLAPAANSTLQSDGATWFATTGINTTAVIADHGNTNWTFVITKGIITSLTHSP